MNGEQQTTVANCPYPCKKTDQFEDIATFKGSVVSTLQSIDRTLKERKADADKDEDHVWEAINEMRKDIKSLYWKVGIIAGGASMVTSAATTLLVRAVQ